MNPAPSLPLWVVYDGPIDLPGRFVARQWIGERPSAELLQGKTLADVRDKLPPGLYRLDRAEADDPKIVEVWL